MPTFETPEPISVRIEAGTGSVRLLATDRIDTVVEVRPRDESSSSDVWAAEHVRVECGDGKLLVSGPKRGLPRFGVGVVDVKIALPSRSRVSASLASAAMSAEGEFTDFRFASGSGNIEVDRVSGKLKAANASGSVAVHTVAGYASVTNASGAVRIDSLDGDARVKAASGALTVGTLRGNLKARTAAGSVTVAAAVCGSVLVHTGSGGVAVGVVEGTAVRLDLVTGSGVVTNLLTPTDGPATGDQTLVLRVRSASADIDIHRASPAPHAVVG
ncbi:hypothetical protein MB901379_01652 [Mycobacterium basiliense]|uniref:DUF4097 domain-containing protein n=1 Tax=Mycobacterium basiliense TaxID=2094119 RepID=A0A447GCA6_9MYCO|nr:DUF4097 family beta strand repeat-containing protein [Mycobacterium basiliense]VDM88096.1 hypothetical protein MB901379_01652 [Mycobacterium basiliense]